LNGSNFKHFIIPQNQAKKLAWPGSGSSFKYMDIVTFLTSGKPVLTPKFYWSKKVKSNNKTITK
jgi:hypothetical protein